eukprot:TRINITY_DN2255_c0_g1_i1.p1 TRINITY_DN2255_c0_g1~~TRINITY_DN2255_c0_g1_i1.p1  ORF type:complete len:323 (-),score=51.75 TRINITY_DN2255_c0_g1_i1:98-1066(-)
MFETEGDCNSNCTVHSQPPCIHLRDGWICNCMSPWNWETRCHTDFYNDYQQISLAYALFGFIILIPGILLYCIEISLHIYFKRKVKNLAFIAKILTLLFGLCRLYHYGDVSNALVTHTYPTSIDSLALGQIFFWLPDLFGLVVYFIFTIMWLNLVLTMKNMSTETTLAYTLARNIYMIVTVVLIIGGIILAGLLVLANPIFYILYVVWIGVPLVVSVLFCLINVYKLHYQIKNMDDAIKEELKRKNLLLTIISLLFLITFVDLVATILYGLFTHNYKAYHAFQFSLRAEELILFYLFFIFVQRFIARFFRKFQTTSSAVSSI